MTQPTPPTGIKSQFVLWHPESDQYMYAHSQDECDILCGSGELCDVTGDEAHCAHAEAQLGPWQIDANEQQDEELVLASGSIATTEGEILIIESGEISASPELMAQIEHYFKNEGAPDE